MKPKEKAIELIDKMSFETHKYNAISCALIAIDEILKVLYTPHKNESEYRYWEEVKQEIKNK